MSLFCFPSAASSTIRARCTSLTLVSFERTSLVSSPRSSSVNTISVATRTIAPNYLAVVLMTLPNPDKFHQEQNTTLATSTGTLIVPVNSASAALCKFVRHSVEEVVQRFAHSNMRDVLKQDAFLLLHHFLFRKPFYWWKYRVVTH